MSRYLTLPGGELVGYSVWPHDPLYRPAVGVFRDGGLAAHALCELPRPVITTLSRSLPARVLRRLRLSTPQAEPMPLEGPAQRCWFRVRPDGGLHQRLLSGDPGVTVARLEDGERLANADPKAAAPSAPSGAWTVERLLQAADSGAGPGLNGFPALAAAQPCRQLDAVYMDLLGRMPDPEAHRNYLPQLESGAWTVLDLQRTLLGSEEFARRPLGLQDRVGALITSPLWLRLAEADGERPAIAPDAAAFQPEPLPLA